MKRGYGILILSSKIEIGNTVFIRIAAGANIVYFEVYFPNILSIFEKKYFRESNYSSRTEIDMMHYYDNTVILGGEGKKLFITLGGDYSSRGYYSSKYSNH